MNTTFFMQNAVQHNEAGLFVQFVFLLAALGDLNDRHKILRRNALRINIMPNVHKKLLNELLFISKVYLKKEFRGRGYARKAFEFIENEAKNRGLKKTRLTVNRHNDDTIAIYKKLGMYIADEKAADIGNGFVMDDYIFEKDL